MATVFLHNHYYSPFLWLVTFQQLKFIIFYLIDIIQYLITQTKTCKNQKFYIKLNNNVEIYLKYSNCITDQIILQYFLNKNKIYQKSAKSKSSSSNISSSGGIGVRVGGAGVETLANIS